MTSSAIAVGTENPRHKPATAESGTASAAFAAIPAMSHYLDLLTLLHRADTQLVIGAVTGAILILWVAARRAGTAPTIPALDGAATFWRVVGIGVPALAVAITLIGRDAATTATAWVFSTLVATELALRVADARQAWHHWATAQIGLSMVFLLAVTRSPHLLVPPIESTHPWAPWVGAALLFAAAKLLHQPPPEHRRRVWLGVITFGLFATAVQGLQWRRPFDPAAAISHATAPAADFAVHELEARADFLCGLDESHHARPRLPADVERLRPYDAYLPALAATLTVDTLDPDTSDELRRALPLAELLARRSEPAALVVAANLHFAEIRAHTVATWRAELEERWNLALQAPHNRLVQMMQVLTAATRSHESAFLAGRRDQVRAELQGLWRNRLTWRGCPGALPGFASQAGSDQYDPANTSAAVRLAQAYGWPEGTDPRLLAHGQREAHGEPFLAAFTPAPRPSLHDAALLGRLASFGPVPMSPWSFLQRWRDALLLLLPLLATWSASRCLRQRFPHGAPGNAASPPAIAPLPIAG